ncbi:hypothetical protein ACFQY5_38370 [Paeniroseomonas aquatica]|uniref:Uncharacterized protein n=1 Tax=Paeniroseomonas aquatica TaxID=373043 RepID=A0ABT8ABL2_9PROT|nr:hypothetical protein [Paeniroseomonas aquatica]MDN3567217.1 hypothetical protein [Paeniroseomonas aquatica]
MPEIHCSKELADSIKPDGTEGDASKAVLATRHSTAHYECAAKGLTDKQAKRRIAAMRGKGRPSAKLLGIRGGALIPTGYKMISPVENARVVMWLAANSSEPVAAMQLWAQLLLHRCPGTGQVMQTRSELGKLVNISADEVSRIITELASIGAATRKRVKVSGMRGPGVAWYFVGPPHGTSFIASLIGEKLGPVSSPGKPR